MQSVAPGQIILLNGTSSSGKTSIAEELLLVLETPYFHLGVDASVQCPVDELERRERARGDRQVGQAASQLAQVHTPGIYDVVCDTGAKSARDCALQINDSLAPGRTLRAFDQPRALGAERGSSVP